MNIVNSSSNADEKARIRDKYRYSSTEGIEVIPAIGEVDFYSDVSSKRVAVYARVSTDDSRQTSSFELQQSHYEGRRIHPADQLLGLLFSGGQPAGLGLWLGHSGGGTLSSAGTQGCSG